MVHRYPRRIPLLSSRFPLALVAATSIGGILLSLGCGEKTDEAAADLPESISFNDDVRPIFVQNCTACHGGVKKVAGVSFIYEAEALGVSESGKRIVKPGDPAGSELFRRVIAKDEKERMPPADHGEPLDEREVAILEKWISQGAVWEDHWAYIPPQQPELPEVAQSDWPQNDIDRFTLARMEAEGLSPNSREEKAALLRRLSLDLVGLPPSPAEVQAFVEDESPDAFEEQVDRLLASSAYGERWAVPWLDLARYADTMGYESDNHRDIWPYRDWVIKALNEDMPFDQFTTEQMAGDLLPEPRWQDYLATAFHRNSKTNVEGGTDDEEYRIAAVIDRVNTTWQAWMGTTFGCVQCHSHPYDPFPHESYYEFLAFFDNTQDHNTGDGFPTIEYALERSQQERVEALEKEYREAALAYAQPFQSLAESVEWAALIYEKAEATQGVVIYVERDEQGRELLQTGPNTPKGTIHTITAESDLKTIRALRIDGLMQKGASVEKPGDPFILSYIEGAVIDEKGEATKIQFARVIADEAIQRTEAERSLDATDVEGWSTYPKQHYPRWAVFLPCDPIELPSGSKLEIVLHHNQRHDGAQQPVLRRFRVSASDDLEWSRLNGSRAARRSYAAREFAQRQLKEIDTVKVPVAKERAPQYARVSNVFERGDWINRGEAVKSGVPSLLKSPDGSPIKDRYELSRWIVSEENPLTARVAVNRYWEQLFGLGIVETLEDFGSSGLPPSNQALLDDLALKFQGEMEWSVKALLKEIVLSATYQQSGQVDEDSLGKDPRNRWLSRGPRTRLTAEMVRDNALTVSELLSKKMFGEPVMPPQPEGVWRTVYNKQEWKDAEGEDRYRRAIYTYWKRSTPYPSFISFDAPSRDVCSPRRITTNTPLQALVTLNDPVYMECAANLASLAMTPGSSEPTSWIEHAYKRAILREPDEQDVASLRSLYDAAVEEATAEKSEASIGGQDPKAYAMTIVSNAIMNLDAFLVK